MLSCPHPDGMVPINAADILHIFAYIDERPQFYQMGEWPQLFLECAVCCKTRKPIYVPIAWESALAWAQRKNA